MWTLVRRYLIAGLLVWLPLGITVLAVNFLVKLFDGTLMWLPEAYRPSALLGYDIPGMGLILSVVVIFFTGMLVTNYLGRQIMRLWESFLERIPLVRTLYAGVKQIAEALFGNGTQSFQKVYLIEYPRKGLWTLAFQTSLGLGEAQCKAGGEEIVNLFVPTTPNPTSGFFIMCMQDDLIELEMSVDEALKMVISGGVVVPPWPERENFEKLKEEQK